MVQTAIRSKETSMPLSKIRQACERSEVLYIDDFGQPRTGEELGNVPFRMHTIEIRI